MNKDQIIIIAEAGVNHNGDLQKAFQLVDVAAEAGVDYIKFQTFKAEKLVSASAKKANYQIENTKDGAETQLEMLKKLELSESDHEKLVQYCRSKNVRFFSTAFDLDSLSYLAEIHSDIVKVPSGEITNLPYLRKAAYLFENIILSTGMATMQEIREAVDVFKQAGIADENITILHCNSEYPTPMRDVNLGAMLTIGKEFNTAVGYSDHTLGIEVSIAAAALGARLIEKHFTLDRNMEGPDHKASLEPSELKSLVLAVRNIQEAMGGTGLKEPSLSEKKNIVNARKSIVAKVPIKKGEIYSESNLTTKRPGSGISPMLWDKMIGLIANRDYDEDDLITL